METSFVQRTLNSMHPFSIFFKILPLVLSGLWGVFPLTATEEPASLAPPESIEVDGVPEIPAALAARLHRYQDIESARFLDWDPKTGGMLISRRHENLDQLHCVLKPGEQPQLLTRGDEPVRGGVFLPNGDIVFSRGQGGDEQYQVYLLYRATGEERLLTDGTSRNLLQRLPYDGRRIAFTSTRRNGRDADIYLKSLENGKEARPLYEVDRETWIISDRSLDGRKAVLLRYISRNESYPRLLDVESGKAEDLPSELDPKQTMKGMQISRASIRLGSTGQHFFFVSDARGKFRELARLHMWTVYAANEGHGFSRRENRDYETATRVVFLKQFLGLRSGADKDSE